MVSRVDYSLHTWCCLLSHIYVGTINISMFHMNVAREGSSAMAVANNFLDFNCMFYLFMWSWSKVYLVLSEWEFGHVDAWAWFANNAGRPCQYILQLPGAESAARCIPARPATVPAFWGTWVPKLLSFTIWDVIGTPAAKHKGWFPRRVSRPAIKAGSTVVAKQLLRMPSPPGFSGHCSEFESGQSKAFLLLII
jgi:hypothetical protein